MMRAAIIRLSDNIVENIIVADAATDAPPHKGVILVNVDETVCVGWVKQGETFVDPNPPAPPEPIPPRVPESITRRQCALQLLAMNQITAQEALEMTKTAAVPAAISAIFDAQVASGKWTPEQRIRAEIDFAATNYYRSNSLLGLMGLTGLEIDGFFIAAAAL
jgi:hypothetical protein